MSLIQIILYIVNPKSPSVAMETTRRGRTPGKCVSVRPCVLSCLIGFFLVVTGGRGGGYISKKSQHSDVGGGLMNFGTGELLYSASSTKGAGWDDQRRRWRLLLTHGGKDPTAAGA